MILFLTLLACVSDPRGGTAVGNPTGFTVDTAPVTTFKVDGGSAVVEEVRSRPCDGTEQSEPVGHEVDLYGSTVVQAGPDRSCVLTIAFGGPLVYVGQHQGRQVRLQVPLAEVAFRSPPGGIPGGSRLLVQLGSVDWVLASQLAHDALAEGEAQAVAEALRAGSLLYTDVDGDFALGPAELEAGPIASALTSTPGTHAEVVAGAPHGRRATPGPGASEGLRSDDAAASADDETAADDAPAEPDDAAGTASHGGAEERASDPEAAEGTETSTEDAAGAPEDDDASTETATDVGSSDDDASSTGSVGESASESGTSVDSDDAGEADAGEPVSPETTDEPDAGEPGMDDTSSTEHEDEAEDADTEAETEAEDDDHADSGRHAGRGRNPFPGAPRGRWRDRGSE